MTFSFVITEDEAVAVYRFSSLDKATAARHAVGDHFDRVYGLGGGPAISRITEDTDRVDRDPADIAAEWIG